jgi:hypothetical protein
MVTEYDKAIVAFLIPILAYINQKYGFAFPVDPQIVGYFVSGLTLAAVYFVPNKPKAG